MKRLLIPFVAAFGLSLGVATGVVMVRAPKQVSVVAKPLQPKQDSSHKVLAVHDTPHDTWSEPIGQPQSTATPAAAGNAAATTPVMLASTRGTQTKSDSDKATSVQKMRVPAAKPAAAAPDTVVGRKLAKVFGAMQAKDAARVLEQMDDGDVQTILASLSNKQQAAILGTFPAQRAATIMRATLRNAGGEQ